ncbi:MAG: plastocyanin/azurin family copper-binding protein [Oscillochloridaceae bacterium umkhey_bin13]
MSWRSSQSPRPSRPSSSGSGGPPLLDPVLQGLIIATLTIGVVALGLAAALGGTLGQGGTQTGQTAPTAAPRPTAPPVATMPPAGTQPTAAPSGPATIPTEPLGPALASGSGQAITIGSAGDALAFDLTSVSVPNGLVTLTFVNNATAVQHNWVLVQGDDVVASAVNDAAQDQVRATRNAAGAVPPADTPGLLVSTHMLDAGDSTTFTFETPGPGTYKFICTFPGHYLAGMVGELVVN